MTDIQHVYHVVFQCLYRTLCLCAYCRPYCRPGSVRGHVRVIYVSGYGQATSTNIHVRKVGRVANAEVTTKFITQGAHAGLTKSHKVLYLIFHL